MHSAQKIVNINFQFISIVKMSVTCLKAVSALCQPLIKDVGVAVVAPLGVLSGRGLHSTASLDKKFNRPLSATELPRPAGISSMYRLPVYETAKGFWVTLVFSLKDIANITALLFLPYLN